MPQPEKHLSYAERKVTMAGDGRRTERGVQLVIDALKLAPTNPSFLNMRDAILQAAADSFSAGELDEATHGAVRAGIWRTFARFGMGVNASSHGAQLTGIVADDTLPADVDEPVKA